jgi:hypothetical protein
MHKIFFGAEEVVVLQFAAQIFSSIELLKSRGQILHVQKLMPLVYDLSHVTKRWRKVLNFYPLCLQTRKLR